MRTLSCASAVLLVVAAGMPSYAQDLTENQFLEDALTNNPNIAVAEADLAATAGNRRQAGVLSNPALSWEREDPDVAARQDTWRLSWRLPFDGRKHRVAEADAAVAVMEAMLNSTRLEVRLELRKLFTDWYVSVERERALKVHLNETRRLASWIRARAEQGEAAGVEARRLELEVEVLSRQHAAARAEMMALRAAAAAWSGLVIDGSRPKRPALAPPPSAVDVSVRPDLKALEQRVAEVEARQQLRNRVLEPPVVSVGWTQLRDTSQSFDGPVLGVVWPVPVFDRNQGERQAAAAEAERSRAQLEAARQRAVQHVEAALASYSHLYSGVAPDTSLTPENEIIGAVLAAFEAGEASLTDVLDSLRTTVDVQLARIETLAAALNAGRELEAALGQPILPGGSS